MVVHNCLVLPKHNSAVFYSEINHKLTKLANKLHCIQRDNFGRIRLFQWNDSTKHKDMRNMSEARVTFWDNVQYGSVVKPFKPKAQYDNLPIHNSSYKILHEFLHFYLLAKTEIFYVLNGFVLAAKRNCFFILKDQFSPVFIFITEICLLLKRTSIKLHIVLCKLFLNYKPL